MSELCASKRKVVRMLVCFYSFFTALFTLFATFAILLLETEVCVQNNRIFEEYVLISPKNAYTVCLGVGAIPFNV